MGNVTGAGLGMAIGALGGPVGMAIGFTIGGGVGMTAEIANDTSAFGSMEGDGGHHIDYISLSTKALKVRTIYVMKTDLLWTGFNTVSSFGRVILAPISTLTARNNSFWM